MLQPDQVGDTGPSDLAKAVRDDGTPGAEQALRSEGFVEGYLRQWVGPARADITVFVYQFATAAGSQADFQRGTVNLANQSPPGATPFTVDGLPTAQSNGLIGSSPNLSAAVVTFTSGVFLAEVVCDGPALAGLQDCASAIAKDQFSRL
jgi:hypothetical protein